MERTSSSARPGRDACADDAHGQTHQCRLSNRGLNAADQHHDAGTWSGADAICATRAGISIGGDGDRTTAIAASHSNDNARASGG